MEVVAGALTVAEDAARLPNHPPVDTRDKPGPLGRTQELARHDEGTVGIDHAQQQLISVDCAGRQVLDRLRVKDEHVRVEGVLDSLDPGLAKPDIRLHRPSRRERDAVATGVLGLVHCRVGVDEQVVGSPLPRSRRRTQCRRSR